MMKILINWLDNTFGSFPNWSDLKYLDQAIGFKTRYGYIVYPTSPPQGNVATGDLYFDTRGNTLFINVSNDPANPVWSKI